MKDLVNKIEKRWEIIVAGIGSKGWGAVELGGSVYGCRVINREGFFSS